MSKDYKNKMVSMLNDCHCNEILKSEPTGKFKTRCHNLLNKLRDNQLIDNIVYNSDNL